MIHNIHNKACNGSMKLKKPFVHFVDIPGPQDQLVVTVFVIHSSQFKGVPPKLHFSGSNRPNTIQGDPLFPNGVVVLIIPQAVGTPPTQTPYQTTPRHWTLGQVYWRLRMCTFFELRLLLQCLLLLVLLPLGVGLWRFRVHFVSIKIQDAIFQDAIFCSPNVTIGRIHKVDWRTVIGI
jgi:hypothetical protein